MHRGLPASDTAAVLGVNASPVCGDGKRNGSCATTSPLTSAIGTLPPDSGADIRGIFLTASGVVVLLILLLVAKQFCGKRALMGRTFWFYGVPQPTPSLFGPRLQRPLPQIYRLHKLPKTHRLNSKRGHSLRRPHPYWKPQTLHVSHLQSLDARLEALSRASKRSSPGPYRIGLHRYLPGMSTLNQQVFSHSFLGKKTSQSVSTIHPQAPESIEPPSTIPSIKFSDSDDTDTVSVDFWPPPPDEMDYWPADIEELDERPKSSRLQNLYQGSPRQDRAAISLSEFLKTGETIETPRSYVTRL